jgi:hypothetical protein
VHINSCTYVRFALAVWKADPTKFEQYHNRLMEGDRPPSLDAARQYGEELVGKEPFTNLNDPATERRIEEAVALYRLLSPSREESAIPKLILPEHVVHGEIQPLQHMYDVLESHLNIKPIRTQP